MLKYFSTPLLMSISNDKFMVIVQKNCNKSHLMLDETSSKTSLNIFTNYDRIEPLLLEEPRLSVYPIVHHDIWKLYEKQRSAFWVPGEILMSDDKRHYNNQDEATKTLINHVIAFFATADGSVINTMDRFLEDIKTLEIQYGYQYQAMMECIHADMYGKLINELIDSEEEKLALFNAVETMPCVSEKNAWGRKWSSSAASYAQRVLANAIVEGIFFSGSFCVIHWIKKKNIMPGLCQSNELISKDEGMHCEFAYTIYNNKIVNKLPEEVVKEMVADAVSIEKKFIIEAIQCGLIGMNNKLMSQYIEYVADVLLQNVGCSKLFGSKQPFDFMDDFCMQIKGNFFEVRQTTYKKVTDEMLDEDDSDDF